MGIGLVVLLGVLQGLTEFLPVSSSGHLRILAELFGVDNPQTLFDILLHVGSLVAVVVVYRELFWKMLWAFGRFLRRPASLADEPYARLVLLAGVGTVPTGAIAITFGDRMEGLAAEMAFVGAMLLVNGFILIGLGVMNRRAMADDASSRRSLEELRVTDALIVGTAQGFGIFRGISRSGSTIAAGLMVGLQQDAAAALSFVLSVPAILGALVMKMDFEAIQAEGVGAYIVGAVVSAVVGTIALWVLLRLLNRGKLHHFAWYCFAAGLFALLWGPLSA